MKLINKRIFKRLVGVMLTLSMIFSVCIPAAALSVKDLLKRNEVQVTLGESTHLRSGLFNIKAEWSSSDTSIVSVDSRGNVTGISIGEAKVTRTARSLFGTVKKTVFYIEVIKPKADFTVKVGQSLILSETDGKTVYKSSDKKVAVIDGNTVIGVGIGIAEITVQAQKINMFRRFGAKFAGASDSYTVEVISNENYEGEFLPPALATLFGVSADEYDSDGDGLSNCAEVYILSTDPTLCDTDGDGISDAEEDFDTDGLTNIKEVKLGTKLNGADTDGDGASDGDEVNELDTDPLIPDTDGDGLTDGDEYVLGLCPTKKMTDGITPDGKRVFEQHLAKENIEEILLDEENAAIPSLMLTTTGNINSRVCIISSVCDTFGDSRAIVGEPVDVCGDDLGEGKITFSLKNSSSYSLLKDGKETSFSTSVICRYADGVNEYLRTDHDEENNTLTADISKAGTYFVLDIGGLFGELGYKMPNSVYSNRVNFQYKPHKASDVMAQADIVFIIDATGSMSEEIKAVKENISGFVDTLSSKGVSASLALVSYQDLEADGENSTQVHKNGADNWFYDVDSYKNAIASLTLGDGGDYPECALDALETSRLLDMRASAGKIFVLVTDANYKTDNRYGIASMNDEIDLLKNAGVSCCVISKPFWANEYYDLYTETNGTWGDIYGDFSTELSELAESIGSDVVGDGHWIYLDGAVPTPVRLNEKPYVGSTVDTDGDGVPDIRELETITPNGSVDLDALLTEISGGIITGTNYGIVETYTYISNPAVGDTDFDGVDDYEDNMPKSNTVKGIMHYPYDSKACNVEFEMDYRDIIDGDNTKYSKNLSVLSILYAGDTYDETYIEITEGAKTGGSDTGKNLGTLLGLDSDSKFISVKSSEYSYDKDDVTDFFVGHKKIIYNGVENEVVIVAVRGTNGTNAEWSSNFDVGANTAEYYNATGKNHPDWKNKNNHKGFDVTATRVYNKLIPYLEANIDSKARKTILICGHSRGAAIANILGARFEREQPEYNSFTYTFATPYSTTDSDAGSYKTVFNVVNSDDLITALPLEKWGFKKYGTTKSVSIRANYASGKAEGSFKWLTGVDYNDDGGTQRTLDCFAAIADNRAQLYKLDTTADGKVYENDVGHLTKGGAEKELVELSATLESEKLARFCTLTVTGSLAWWHVEVNYCPAYFMQIIANMTTGVGPVLGRDVKGKYATAKTSFVASSGFVVVGGLTHPHMQPTYYLIARNDFLPLK